MTPSAWSRRAASRTVWRLTPYSAVSSASVGKRARNSPRSILRRRSARTCAHRGKGLFLSITALCHRLPVVVAAPCPSGAGAATSSAVAGRARPRTDIVRPFLPHPRCPDVAPREVPARLRAPPVRVAAYAVAYEFLGVVRGGGGVLRGFAGRQHQDVLGPAQRVLRDLGARTHGGVAGRAEPGVRPRADRAAVPGHTVSGRQVAVQDGDLRDA